MEIGSGWHWTAPKVNIGILRQILGFKETLQGWDEWVGGLSISGAWSVTFTLPIHRPFEHERSDIGKVVNDQASM